MSVNNTISGNIETSSSQPDKTGRTGSGSSASSSSLSAGDASAEQAHANPSTNANSANSSAGDASPEQAAASSQASTNAASASAEPTSAANQTNTVNRSAVAAQVQQAESGSSSPQSASDAPPLVWKSYQKIAFRIAFIFFILMTIPENPGWYTQWFQFDWTSLHYRDLYDIARYQPSFIRGAGFYGYGEWLVLLAVSTVGGLIWTALDKKRREYNVLYYWLTVIVRYRAAIGIIGFAFTKVLPVQMPYPSTGILNTNFGDLTAQKIYWLSISIVPWYQVFAGVVELTAGVLLFFRKTAVLGAIILFGALGDIVYVNFAYDGGVHVYSSYFVLFAAFIIAKEIPQIYNLFILERYTRPVNFNLKFMAQWLKTTRIALKAGVIFLFLFVFFYIQLNNFLYDPYKQPAAKGVPTLRGYYQVSEFKLNNQVIPYSPQDSLAWQDVTFENWTTLTFKQNRPVQLDLSNGGGSPMRDINRTFEIAGVGGGRRVFYYEADTVNHILYLQDKFRDLSALRAGDKNKKGRKGNAAQQEPGSGTAPQVSKRAQKLSNDQGTDSQSNQNAQLLSKGAQQLSNDQGADSQSNQKAQLVSNDRKQRKKSTAELETKQANFLTDAQEYAQVDPAGLTGRRLKGITAERKLESGRKRMVLHYSTIDGKDVILKGINENKDSVSVILHRVNRQYALKPSTLSAGKY
ncbi:hypothetical protein OQY15_01870 [Pedobacter sp. MC2016-15]|uniref:hypothetical protein n=1 Tax=Pedobacter sp. MC2016-15 TaxID=2994473 RepID=UPI00224734A5|nr:hypothetical protein [Pedobacter sp. MC2016-15]MCX2477817.1 hypothetical protein [Pedobacter sp. MC2016-15]